VAREPTENLWLDTPELVVEHDAITKDAKEPNELVDMLANLKGEVWHVDGKHEERVSTEAIRNELHISKADACRIHNLGRRIHDDMTQLGWTKATKNIRCHKQGEEGQSVAGYFRPAQKPDEADEQPAKAAKKDKDVGGGPDMNELVAAMRDRPQRSPTE
jgi:hypothetical protein